MTGAARSTVPVCYVTRNTLPSVEDGFPGATPSLPHAGPIPSKPYLARVPAWLGGLPCAPVHGWRR